MNSNQNNGKDNRPSGEQKAGDPFLDDELNQLDQLYRSDEPEEPPQLLDQAILNKAKQAVEPTNGWLDFGWVHGATTVALIVLTFSIVTFQRETGEFEVDDYPSTSSTVREPASPTTNNSDSKTTNPSINSTSSPLPGKTANRVSDKANDSFSTQATDADQSFTDRATMSKDDLTVAPMSAPLNEPLKEEVQAESQNQDRSLRQLSAPASTELLREKKQSEATVPAADMERDEKRVQLDSLGAVAGAAESETPQAASPQQLMLAQILELKSAGDESWLELLNVFEKRYPDFPLPEELQNKD